MPMDECCFVADFRASPEKLWLHGLIEESRFLQSRKYSFPGQNYHFPGNIIKDLKVINQDTGEKAYHIYSMYD